VVDAPHLLRVVVHLLLRSMTAEAMVMVEEVMVMVEAEEGKLRCEYFCDKRVDVPKEPQLIGAHVPLFTVAATTAEAEAAMVVVVEGEFVDLPFTLS